MPSLSKPTVVGCLTSVAALPLLLGTLWIFGLIFNPPAMFSRAYMKPAARELAGVYRLTDESVAMMKRLGGTGGSDRVRISLNQDNSAWVDLLPQFDGFGKAVVCSWVGKGSWYVETNPEGVSRTINIDPSIAVTESGCAKGGFSFGEFTDTWS